MVFVIVGFLFAIPAGAGYFSMVLAVWWFGGRLGVWGYLAIHRYAVVVRSRVELVGVSCFAWIVHD
jgi:hypothetical protein